MKWTCTVCGFKYNEVTGDIDERMCYECLNKMYDEKIKGESDDKQSK